MRLELAIPRDQVLISNFDTWHSVLNHRFLSLSEGEGEAWDDELKMSGSEWRWSGPLPEPWDRWMQQSWERIFDVEAHAASEHRDWVWWWQATFERLELAHVVAVTEFMARKSGRRGW